MNLSCVFKTLNLELGTGFALSTWNDLNLEWICFIDQASG